MEPPSGLIDQEPSTFQRSALRSKFEGECERIRDYAGEPSYLQPDHMDRLLPGPGPNGLDDALGDRQLVHLSLQAHHRSPPVRPAMSAKQPPVGIVLYRIRHGGIKLQRKQPARSSLKSSQVRLAPIGFAGQTAGSW